MNGTVFLQSFVLFCFSCEQANQMDGVPEGEAMNQMVNLSNSDSYFQKAPLSGCIFSHASAMPHQEKVVCSFLLAFLLV
jgi:hypothetical protein